jgi:hypothetical protein
MEEAMTDTKAIGDAINLNMQVGTAIRAGQLNDQIADRDLARQRATIGRLQEQASRPNLAAQNNAYELHAALDKLKADLEATKRGVHEWRHSNEALWNVAKAYAARLGVGDDEFRANFANAIMDLMETDPIFKHTKLGTSTVSDWSRPAAS